MLRRLKAHRVLWLIVPGVVLAACRASSTSLPPTAPVATYTPGAWVTPHAISTSSPTVAPTPRVETPSATPVLTFTPSPVPPTPFPIPTPALPSADGGPVPPGALARLGIGSIEAAALSPDGQLLAVGTTVGVYVYEAHTFDRAWTRAIEAPVKGVAWSPDASMVAVWFEASPIVQVLDRQTGAGRAYLEHSAFIGDVDWSPDSTRLAVGWVGWRRGRSGYGEAPPDPHLSVWDITASDLVFTSQVHYEYDTYKPPIDDVEWSPDGSTIAMVIPLMQNGNGTTFLFDALTGAQKHTLTDQSWAAFSPDGKLLATWPAPGGPDGGGEISKVWLWNVQTGEIIHVLEGHFGGVLAWSRDSSRLALNAYVEDAVLIWDARTGTLLMSLIPGDEFGQVTALEWSANGRYLAYTTFNYQGYSVGATRVWNTMSGELESTSYEHRSWVSMIDWTSQDQGYITVSSEAIFSHSLQQPEPLLAVHAIEGHAAIERLAWLSNTSLAADGSYDQVVEWDVPGRQPTKIGWGEGINWHSVAASQDRPFRAEIEQVTITSDQDGSQRYGWKVIVKHANGAPLYEFDAPQSDNLLIEWSPDGQRLAVGGGLTWDLMYGPFVEGWEANAIMVWDLTIGELLHTFLGHTGRVYSLAWSPDGSMLASGSADGTVIVWDVGQ